MADHEELVAEMAAVEKMPTQDRLKHARKRRMYQLKRWAQREKELIGAKTKPNPPRPGKKRVHFVPSVMLLESAARNDIEEVRRLLTLGVSPDSTNEDGLTALHQFCNNSLIFKRKLKVQRKSALMVTTLLQCCIDASEAMVKLLVEFGADVNAKDSEQWTPLHAAATCGHINLVKFLIAHAPSVMKIRNYFRCFHIMRTVSNVICSDAELLAVNADGNMPYDICEDESTLDYIETEMAKRGITQELIDDTRAANENQMLEDMKRLLDQGGDLEVQDNQGATPLHVASANGYVSVVEFLLDNNVAPDAADQDHWQPIHAAACWGHPEVIELLVQAGANLNAKTKNGETPYDICEDPDLKERIVQLQSEMETKRAAQPNKLKRSQSQNTRSQSIRRTSIRDKSLMSRREAREEAKLRQEKQPNAEAAVGSVGVQDDEAAKAMANNNAEKEKPKLDLKDIEVALNPASSKDTLRRIKGKATEEANNESVKVEIHVTVNTSPSYSGTPAGNGTLAELKKHRADMRSRGASPPDGRHFTYSYPPPSPTVSLKRFRSDPAEIVGNDSSKQGCCIIM
ncbi:PPP1R16B [Cordylochernes scorpioides]|uniref:PPP1R16B n=1 Tax=Cordylochernes scorpioides TaxID=51811 RepID=A0ABY6M026_9ARAC|nr:PPP1R16B [Cordylochernes scorpioides]